MSTLHERARSSDGPERKRAKLEVAGSNPAGLASIGFYRVAICGGCSLWVKQPAVPRQKRVRVSLATPNGPGSARILARWLTETTKLIR